MDLLEVQIDRVRIAAFDGRVLEVFGPAVNRFNVRLLAIKVPGPDKKGRRVLTLTHAGRDYDLSLESEEFETLQPVLDALRAAGVPCSE